LASASIHADTADTAARSFGASVVVVVGGTVVVVVELLVVVVVASVVVVVSARVVEVVVVVVVGAAASPSEPDEKSPSKRNRNTAMIKSSRITMRISQLVVCDLVPGEGGGDG